MQWAKNSLSFFAKPFLFAIALAFGLVPQGHAQGNFQTSAIVGVNKLKTAGALSTAGSYVFNVLLPSNATSEVFAIESTSATNVTYLINFATASLENPFANAPSLQCTKELFNPAGAQFSNFAAQTVIQGLPDHYTCPFAPTSHLLITFTVTSANAQGSLYLIVNTSQNSWLPQQTSNFTYQAITAAGNTQVKGASGSVHTITITQPGATANSITVVDTSAANCTGGTTVMTIPTAQLPSTMVPLTMILDTTFNLGICVVTAGTTSPQLVVAFK